MEHPPGDTGRQITLEGVVERVVYFSEETSYAVARLQIAGEGTVTIVGTMPAPRPEDTLRATGAWVNDPRFGRQFRVESCLPVLPSTVTGIERFLSSRMIKGIGPVTARRLVARFGLETLDVISEQPERLREVEGLGRARCRTITDSWGQHRGIRDVMVFLQGHGVSPAYALKVFKEYGPRAVSVVRQNPYQLALDVSGIGFKTADRIAQSVGVAPDSPDRLKAGLVHALIEMAGEGHTCCPQPLLVERASLLLGAEVMALEAGLAALVAEGRIVAEGDGEDASVYMKPLHVAEVGVSGRLKALLASRGRLPDFDVERALEWVQRKNGLVMAPMQKEAIRKALSGKVVVLTGGPGTGKTTLVNSLLDILETKRWSILLASPTGRAANRLSEVSGRQARTIHRLLEFNPATGLFNRNESRPLDADLVVVDEASMVDISLMHQLLKALPATASLLLVGDVDQLPSVGPGNVLRDIVASGAVEVVRLTEVFRQAQKSLIVVNAHRVNQGQMVTTAHPEGGTADFFFIEQEDPLRALELIKELCARRLPRSFGLSPLDDIQVVTPMHKGTVGVANLNIELQKVLNPPRARAELARGGVAFRCHDRVMQLKNDYDKDVFNGDIGRIAAIDDKEQTLQVKFDNRVVSYHLGDLDELGLAYAISIHKSQGSEYPALVVPLLAQHYIMLQRNLLYTALTRARKLVVVVGSKRAMAMAVRNDRIQRRYSHLAARLR